MCSHICSQPVLTYTQSNKLTANAGNKRCSKLAICNLLLPYHPCLLALVFHVAQVLHQLLLGHPNLLQVEDEYCLRPRVSR